MSMKKLVHILMISLVLLLAVPVHAKADPRGYKIVKVTKKNVNKYFSMKKAKHETGGYDVFLYSKLRKKGYFIVGGDFIIKGTYRHRYKKGNSIRYKTEKFEVGAQGRTHIPDCPYEYPTHEFDYSYKKAKISNIKFKKAKGFVIFALPSNIAQITIGSYDFQPLSYRTREIRLRYELPEAYEEYSDIEHPSWYNGYPYIYRNNWGYYNFYMN